MQRREAQSSPFPFRLALLALLGTMLAIGEPAIAAAESDCAAAANHPLTTAQVRELYGRLKLLHMKKGEYERQDEFDARRASRLANLAGTSFNDLLAISIKLPPQFGEYDADKQILTYNVFGDFVSFDSNLFTEDFDMFDVLVLQRRIKSGESYIGQNAFGARVRVRVESRVGLGIAYTKGQQLIPYGAVNFSLDATQAREFRGSLEMILVGRLEQPYAVELGVSSDPTLDNPVDVSGTDLAVVVVPACIVVKDSKSGRVLQTTLR